MKKPLAAFAALAFSTAISAQDAYQAPLVEQSLLLDITAGEQIVMVGERGHILLSSDGETLGKLYLDDNRTWVDYETLPQNIVDALVLIVILCVIILACS